MVCWIIFSSRHWIKERIIYITKPFYMFTIFIFRVIRWKRDISSASSKFYCTVIVFVFLLPLNILPIISVTFITPTCPPGMPGISKVGNILLLSLTLIETSPSSNSLFLNLSLKIFLLSSVAFSPTIEFTIVFSAKIKAFLAKALRAFSLTKTIAASTKSRIIESTSRPTYPISVNFVASIFMNGAPASFAKRRAISVLPTPV
ncbi:hypothetical protein WwAna0314 [Wolbachia endosymbiont of Drosophila ananassae]|nr:hypothetical protein WwAna0314 [Wolbachia endosymbiont of Drosophila ananassae]